MKIYDKSVGAIYTLLCDLSSNHVPARHRYSLHNLFGHVPSVLLVLPVTVASCSAAGMVQGEEMHGKVQHWSLYDCIM